jgi:maltose O-acetyltransferase
VARIARIIIHDSCRIGARTVILPGVEIGPRTIVFAGSVVSRTLPPDTICAGSPARPIGSLKSYADAHRAQLESTPAFPFAEYGDEPITPERRAELVAALEKGAVYILGSNASHALARHDAGG